MARSRSQGEALAWNDAGPVVELTGFMLPIDSHGGLVYEFRLVRGLARAAHRTPSSQSTRARLFARAFPPLESLRNRLHRWRLTPRPRQNTAVHHRRGESDRVWLHDGSRAGFSSPASYVSDVSAGARVPPYPVFKYYWCYWFNSHFLNIGTTTVRQEKPSLWLRPGFLQIFHVCAFFIALAASSSSAAKQFTPIPGWLAAHVGEADRQIAKPILDRACALYFG
ncbi:hypothetical protein EV291_1277 [Rhizobium sp. BK068]|nr:hypothetical protein EV291_1277 [Rhizobium sp. BK068]